MNLRTWPRMGSWWSHDDTPPPPDSPEWSGTADSLAEHQRRIYNNEKRLDWLARRVRRLEELVAADTIAPVDPAEDGQSR